MIKYCEECGRDVETTIITKKESYEVCGESIEVDAQILICAECGEEFFCEELDSATLKSAYNEYRRRHKLLSPEEIKQIRERYGLSQRSFAKLLNWGDKTIHRYENGSIQDKAHNSLLLFLRTSQNMKAYLMENEVMLDERQKAKVFQKIEELEKGAEQTPVRRCVETFYQSEPSIENGFKTFDYDKLCAMAVYFAHKCETLLKVKLLKLLNYSDMIFYQEHGISMSGMTYVHLPYGPVPQNYDILFGMMEADKVLHIEIEFDNGYERHKVMPDCSIPKERLSADEMEVLDRVYDRFADFGSVEISNYSHGELGYRSTRNGEVISYAYAKEIQLD